MQAIPTGNRRDSVVKCEPIYTFNQKRILRQIGQLSSATMQQIAACLKVSLDLP
jgi:mRNA-degrading endonuclease toxin of MazEF toxin-antitoxin module